MGNTIKEADEGILVKNSAGVLSTVVSLSEIETVDMICEGEIEGLVSAEYTFTGTKGNIGWDSYSVATYLSPPNAVGFGWLRSVYWNEVPIVSSNNTYNYQRLDITKTNGYPNGAVLLNTSSNKNETSISRNIQQRLRASTLDTAGTPTETNKDFIKLYRVLNKECKGVIVNVKVSRLAQVDTKNGNTNTTSVSYLIYYRPLLSNSDKENFSVPITETITGKVNSPYIRSTRIIFPPGPLLNKDFLGWEIKIVRTTPESFSSYLSNQTFVDSLTEIYSTSFTYPNSAIVRARFSAEFFATIPQRAFDTKMLKVLIPSNYDPIKRSYTQTNPNYEWNGTFATNKKWTDNPAWCFYDFVTNERYGLGRFVQSTLVDKFTLYKIAKYCDEMVDDGFGGVEPRFTCNVIIFSQAEAYKILNDMASIFNAILYYANGSIYVSQDSPKTIRTFFTNANVEQGNFIYSSTAKKVRHTVAIVRWNDPKNFFQPTLERVEDADGIRRYGIKEIETVAFGATSRGQANRMGKWVLASELFEKETVSFVAGKEAAILRPGDIIGVYDSNRKTYRNAGRLSSIGGTPSASVVTLDNKIVLPAGSYKFSLIASTYSLSPEQIEDFNSSDITGIDKSFVQTINFTDADVNNSGDNSVIAFSSAFDTANFDIPANAVWVIEQVAAVTTYDQYKQSFDESYDSYRLIKISEKEDYKYEIIALQYSPDKFDSIATNLLLERSPTIIQAVPYPPQSLLLALLSQTNYSKVIEYTFVPPNNRVGLTSYRIYAKVGEFFDLNVPNNTYLIGVLPLSSTRGTYFPTANGNYYFRIYGYNDEAYVFSATYASNNIQVVDVLPIRDVTISSLAVDEWIGDVSEGSTTKDEILVSSDVDPYFTWQVGVKEGGAPPSQIFYRFSARETSSNNIPDSNIYYQITGLTSPSYEFTFETNAALPNGPFRNFDAVVEAVDENGFTSAGNSLITNVSENGWSLSPYGYDIIHVYNDPIDAIDTANYTYIDYNGGINYLFDAGTVPSQAVGGYLFGSTGFFTSGQAVSGFAGITRREFHWNEKERYAFAPAVFQPNINFVTGYSSICFYDAIEEANKVYKDIVTGLYMEDAAPIYVTGLIQDAEVKGKFIFSRTGEIVQNYTLHAVSDGAGFDFLAGNQDNSGIIIATTL